LQAKGDRWQRHSRAELTMMANALIAPWFIEQVRARIAERNSEHLSNPEVPRQSRVLTNETHAQNGAAK
jgi:hypothetical protein